MTRNAEFNRLANATDAHAATQSLELGTGTYHIMDDMTYIHENAGSILVTHRVDQVTSRKVDQVPQAEGVGLVADAPASNA